MKKLLVAMVGLVACALQAGVTFTEAKSSVLVQWTDVDADSIHVYVVQETGRKGRITTDAGTFQNTAAGSVEIPFGNSPNLVLHLTGSKRMPDGTVSVFQVAQYR